MRALHDDYIPLTWWHLPSYRGGAIQPSEECRCEDAQHFSDEERLILQIKGCLDNTSRWISVYGFPVDECLRRYLHSVGWRLASTGERFALASAFHKFLSGVYWPCAPEYRHLPQFSNEKEIIKRQQSTEKKFRLWASQMNDNGLVSQIKARIDSGPSGNRIQIGQYYLYFTSLQKERLIAACSAPALGTYNGHPVTKGAEFP